MSEIKPENAGLEKIRAIALDVDGVLTDGGFWWGADGQELKRFCFADIMGISLARRAGFELVLISGEMSPLVDRLAEKLLIRHVVKGCRDKASALREFSATVGIAPEAICFMRDDINDLAAMEIAGFSAAPASAALDVLSPVKFVAESTGGNGAVRELVEVLLAAQGLDIQEVFAKN